jgi:hypothetical protein
MRFLPGVVAQDLGLDLKEIGLNGGGTTHAPQQRCKPEHQLALHGSSGIVIRDDSRFERLIVFDVFQSDHDGFGSQSVPNCISPRPPFASFGFRTGAPDRIASIGLDLSKRCHRLMQPTAVLHTELPASMPGSRVSADWALLGRVRCGCRPTERGGRAIDPRVLP